MHWGIHCGRRKLDFYLFLWNSKRVEIFIFIIDFFLI